MAIALTKEALARAWTGKLPVTDWAPMQHGTAQRRSAQASPSPARALGGASATAIRHRRDRDRWVPERAIFGAEKYGRFACSRGGGGVSARVRLDGDGVVCVRSVGSPFSCWASRNKQFSCSKAPGKVKMIFQKLACLEENMKSLLVLYNQYTLTQILIHYNISIWETFEYIWFDIYVIIL
jgi:hypothetical protein